ncbi:hypothetical protein [Spiroplasma chrysopicola]|uniref:CopG-like ribbon-helix-helix domain-containing protein n=1 Tax=Spiroplasma chrysopicola DF-1 TaxID=1276227 RepID=R4UH40_9MOLU|nr:hypothetical protein [Spiroplasma chrysopicola]AGM25495.1 hypothetical protein SCHRY_v1c09220 [Spiroplasma chrysopicola DF-1]
MGKQSKTTTKSNNFRIQLKLPPETYFEVKKYTDEEHSLGNVIRYFITEGLKQNEKSDD